MVGADDGHAGRDPGVPGGRGREARGLRGDWERSAIVTDIAWMVHAMKVFGWMVPGETRVYPVAELDAAKARVAGSG